VVPHGTAAINTSERPFMLDTLRANSRSILSYVLFGIIIVVFIVSFGPGSRGCTRGGHEATWAAKVNRATVSPAEFEREVQELNRVYGARLAGDDLQQRFLRARLRQMAMEQLVERELVEQEAARQGIAVSDEDVSDAIQKIPAFQSDGKFDIDIYRRIVSANYGSPARFEEWMRGNLAYNQAMALVRSTVRLTDDEVRGAWLAENDRVSLEFARFPIAAAQADVKVTDAQVQEILAKEGPRIEAFYRDNPARFDRKKRVHARHILVKVPADATQEQEDAAKKRIEDLAQRVKKGEAFEKVAREASDDPGSKEKGGDLGFFGPGAMTKAFEAAAFKLKPGEVSAPVKTQFGWHLIKVEEVQEPEVVPLDKARPEIARELARDDLAKALASRKAREVLQKLRAGKSFAEALPAGDKAKSGAEPVKLGGQIVKPEDTGSFTASAAPNVPRLGPLPELFAAALRASAGEVLPEVFDSPAGPVVARVEERQRPDPAKFEEQKAAVEMRLRIRREAEVERDFVDDLHKKAKIELNEPLLAGNAAGGAPLEED
jgi:peptidyl-prolyl cis-trans isomerase D